MGNHLKSHNVVENNNWVSHFIEFKKNSNHWIVLHMNFIIFESDIFSDLSIDISERCSFTCHVFYFVISGHT